MTAWTSESSQPLTRIVVCAPIYDDWASALALLEQVDAVALARDESFDVLLVDDGSTEPAPARLERPAHGLVRVSILRLRRNLGHQRAIAIGLTHLHVLGAHDAVVVMDGDGEDLPADIPKLLDRCRANHGTKIVFAQRAKRTEGFAFRLGYAGYRALHKLLVGHNVNVGNFSVVPRDSLARAVAISELWNHYAAAVYHARLSIDMVPLDRAQRLAGTSKMNFVALVMHGLSAISVYSDLVGVRVLRAIAVLAVLVLAGIAAVLALRVFTPLAIPGWATSAAGLLLVLFANLTILSMFMAMFALRARSGSSFLPLRDYRHFILDERLLYERPSAASAENEEPRP
jgi:polyisoprenyl-phosphate glycosyltransferase